MKFNLLRSLIIASIAFGLLIAAKYGLPALFKYDLGQIALLVFLVCPLVGFLWGLSEKLSRGNWWFSSLLGALAFPVFFLLFLKTPLENLYIPLVYILFILLGFSVPGFWKWLNTRRYG